MGHADFVEVSGVGGDDDEAIGLGYGSEAAVLGTGTFKRGEPRPKDLVCVIVVAQDGKPVQVTHEVHQEVISDRQANFLTGTSLIDGVKTTAQHFFRRDDAKVNRTGRRLGDPLHNNRTAAQQV